MYDVKREELCYMEELGYDRCNWKYEMIYEICTIYTRNMGYHMIWYDVYDWDIHCIWYIDNKVSYTCISYHVWYHISYLIYDISHLISLVCITNHINFHSRAGIIDIHVYAWDVRNHTSCVISTRSDKCYIISDTILYIYIIRVMRDVIWNDVWVSVWLLCMSKCVTEST